MIKNHEEFNEILLAKRNSGSVTCSFKDMNQFVNTKTNEIAKELFLKELGLKPNRIEGNWKQIDQSISKKILEYILSMDMAYDIELETKPLATMLSNYFLNEFLSNAIYYTNGDFDEDDGFFRLRGWQPITDSTFDTGVLVIDKNNIGILWAEDND
ncbi:hypothetical protein J7J00_25570 [Bacillus sp. ISL-4]|uniref:hypothetical protein n=1 Tax=Bacillus sp. ISL-4 TaxID=2819125 RepID=UPI001BE6684E|nr:hypothetical protein [Bacillus sp. ISL-4]MBT2668780.1 hypothetical protein [Bacillus sp. ISL-4]MBT2673956.1 hypothetical protein [Streptomyces sp. ISL-14]